MDRQEEQELLIRVDANLINLVKAFGTHTEDFRRHTEHDDKSFKVIDAWKNRITGMFIGGWFISSLVAGIIGWYFSK